MLKHFSLWNGHLEILGSMDQWTNHVSDKPDHLNQPKINPNPCLAMDLVWFLNGFKNFNMMILILEATSNGLKHFWKAMFISTYRQGSTDRHSSFRTA